jgi:hypothetical protein
MSENYKKFGFTPKETIQGSGIGEGEVDFQHLSPSLFSEVRNIQLHSHTGVGSSRVRIQDLTGYFPSSGFVMYSSDGTKKYIVTIDSATGAFVLTES